MRFSLIMPMRVVFLLSRGLSLAEVGIIESLSLIASVLVELPTGSFADSYGRKLSLMIGYFIFGLGFVVVALSDSFVGFAIGFSLAEVGESFVSGSLSAWIADHLEARGWQAEIANVFGQSRAVLLLANVAGGVMSGYLAKGNLVFPFLASSLSAFISFVLAASFVQEVKVLRHKGSFLESIKEPIKNSLEYCARQKLLLMLLLNGMLVFVGVSCFMLAWQPYLKRVGADLELLGITYALISVGFSLGAFLGGIAGKKYSNPWSMIAGLGICFGALLLLPLIPNIPMIISLFFLWEFGFGFQEPNRYAWMISYTPSEVRATLLSMDRLLLTVGNAVGMLAAGFIGEMSLSLTFILGAVIFLVSAIVLWPFSKEEKLAATIREPHA
jgi:MFS family permease